MTESHGETPVGMSLAEDSASSVHKVELIGEHELQIHRAFGNDVIRIVNPAGRVGISISVTREGFTLNLEGAGLRLETTGELGIRAERLALHGEKGVDITTGGDATIRVAGDLHSEARIQNITATLGNVNLRANDDVRLDGERIRLNSPDVRPLVPRKNGLPENSEKR